MEKLLHHNFHYEVYYIIYCVALNMALGIYETENFSIVLLLLNVLRCIFLFNPQIHSELRLFLIITPLCPKKNVEIIALACNLYNKVGELRHENVKCLEK